jgi:IclR family acetate operon transcriptional repressor
MWNDGAKSQEEHVAKSVKTIEPSPEKPKGDGGVQSISRALSILDRLAEFDEGLTLTELARGIALPPSSAHRILTTLQRHRFVRFEPATMSWHVGVQAFVVGNAFARSRDMVTLAVPHMRRLMTKTGETANFFMLDGEALICMAQIQSQQTVRAISRPGGGVEMHRSAAGKAIMAHMSDAEVGVIVERNGLPRYTEHTIVTHDALVLELARIRERGFAVDNEEFSLGLRCIAAPIFDEAGAVHAAVSLAGPAGRIAENRVDALGELVALCSKSVTSEIGGRRPTIQKLG